MPCSYERPKWRLAQVAMLDRHRDFTWWLSDGFLGPLHFNDIQCEHCAGRPVASKVGLSEVRCDDEPTEMVLCNVCSATVLLWHNELWEVDELIWF